MSGTEDGNRDLGDLTLAAGRNLVGERFIRRNEAGPEVVLTLLEAEKGRRDPRAPGEDDRPFTLLFRGPAEPRLTQGMHDLDHPRRSLPGIFLVPVGGDSAGRLYEAVFA
jgi:hypothetical protein